MRNPGAHLAVAADGDWCGSLSGGCIEAAVVAEALDALRRGETREVRFGAGSPYIDIRLPCGGSLDVLINPIEDTTLARHAVTLFERRLPFVLALPLVSGSLTIERKEPTWRTGRDASTFRVSHLPPLSIAIIGHGGSVEALDAQSRIARAVTHVFTPDVDLAARLSSSGTPISVLRIPTEKVALKPDRWTAIAFLFHDHEWETALMVEALASPAFYVGAMGGRAAQARRVEALEHAGVAVEAIGRLRAPIGLIPSSRDPQVLALSVLAEIVRDYDAAIQRADVLI